jgi:hypothetical protein
LSQLSDGIEHALTAMATAVVQQTDEARTARENKQLQEELPKLPSNADKFKHTLHILMRLLNLDDEDMLPTLWHEWANCGKKQEVAILKHLLDSYAQSEHAFVTKTPVVTPKLAQDLIAFNFIGENRDDVNTGLSPFNVIEGGEEYRKHNLELAKVQGALYQNDMGFNLSDIDALQKREIKAVPLCFYDLEKSLGLLGNLFAVVLGNHHILTVAYKQFWDLLSRNLRDDLRDLIDIQFSIRPAHILRSVQLITYSWFSARRLNVAPPQPQFADILIRIQMAAYQLPGLPGIYHELTYTTKQTSGVPSLTPSTSLSSGTSSGASDISTLSGSAKPGSGAPGRQAPTITRNTFVRNADPDASLQALIPQHLQLRNIIQNATVPLNDANLPMCLSYHLRRGCWSQCKRAQDHSRKLSGAEKQRIVTFVSSQLQKLSTLTPPASIVTLPQVGAPALPQAIPQGTAQGSLTGPPAARG